MPSGLRCVTDAGQLESALLNIAINARDAMPEGGTLSFACEACVGLPADAMAVLGESADREAYIRITIADTGHGMTEAVRDRVFEPFFTTKELGRGTGLGMSTVYGFVRQSRGSIRLETSPGAGTAVLMYLPRPKGEAEPALPAALAAEGLPKGLVVMLVEDDAEVRRVVCRVLQSMGCRVVEFTHAEPALASLAGAARCDLLLSDIALGAGMRGSELARRVRAKLPRVAVLLMSGYSAELLRALETSADSWELLRKPFERDELAHAVVRALASHPPEASVQR
jgi:CheY-like chemotaxis protein